MSATEPLKPSEAYDRVVNYWMTYALLGWFMLLSSVQLQLRGHDPLLVGGGVFAGVVAISVAVHDFRGETNE